MKMLPLVIEDAEHKLKVVRVFVNRILRTKFKQYYNRQGCDDEDQCSDTFEVYPTCISFSNKPRMILFFDAEIEQDGNIYVACYCHDELIDVDCFYRIKEIASHYGLQVNPEIYANLDWDEPTHCEGIYNIRTDMKCGDPDIMLNYFLNNQ